MRVTSAIACTGAILILVGGAASCAAVAAGAVGGAGVAYALGDLEGEVQASPPKVVKAAREVLEEMQVHVDAVDSTGLDGEVLGHTALDEKVAIAVERVDDLRSKISIRIGAFGDEQESRRIFDAIQARL